MDMINREDKIGVYLRTHADNFIFDELSDKYLEKNDLKEILSGVPIPIRKTELESISTLTIARNMGFIIGCDPGFKYRENYIKVLAQYTVYLTRDSEKGQYDIKLKIKQEKL